MGDHSLMVATAAGLLAVIVTEPEGKVRSSAIVLHGGARAGNNRVFARLARALAAVGMSVVRVDYPGQGLSPGSAQSSARRGDTPGDEQAVRELIAWIRERTGTEPFLIGSCYGGRIAARVAANDVRAPGLVFLSPALQVLSQQQDSSRSKRVRRRFKALVRRIVRRRRTRAPAEARARDAENRFRIDREVAVAISAAVRRSPSLLVTGEKDVCAQLLPRLQRHLGASDADLEIDVVPDMVLHSYPTAESQEVAIDRVLSWIRRRVDETPPIEPRSGRQVAAT